MKISTLLYLLGAVWEYVFLLPWFIFLMVRYHVVNWVAPYFMKNVEYSDRSDRNVCDVYPMTDFDDEEKHRVFLFVHGGAWNSGNKTIYSHLGNNVRNYLKNCTVVVCNYRLYPKVLIQDQLNDVNDCIGWIHNHLNNYLMKHSSSDKLRHFLKEKRDIDLTVCGHSAGGHLLFTLLLEKPSKLVRNVISLGGVYDLEKQYEREQERGVENLSGLYGVMKGDLVTYSPYHMVLCDNKMITNVLEGTTNFHIYHGSEDMTVKREFVEPFIKVFTERSDAGSGIQTPRLHSDMLQTFNHSDFVKPLMDINHPSKKQKLLSLFKSIVQ